MTRPPRESRKRANSSKNPFNSWAVLVTGVGVLASLLIVSKQIKSGDLLTSFVRSPQSEMPESENLSIKRKKILMVGDSHTVGPYGKEVFSLIEKKIFSEGKQYEFLQFGVCASRLGWFRAPGLKATKCGYSKRHTHGPDRQQKRATAPNLEHEIEKLRPQLLVIAQGSNYLSYDKQKEVGQRGVLSQKKREMLLDHFRWIEKLIDKYDIKSCLWVTPPKMGRFINMADEIDDFIKGPEGIAGRCRILISKGHAPLAAKVHFSKKSDIANWALKTVDEIKSLVE